jgi:phosphoglycolate phosphatase
MVYKAMKEIGVDRCIYVGDSEVDVLTAKNAGVPCVCVLWGFRDREDLEAAGADYFCRTTKEMEATIRTLAEGF